MKSKTAERILSETPPETVKRVRNSFVIGFLERNGFTLKEEDTYENKHCTVTLFEDHYKIEYWDSDWMDNVCTYTPNLSIYFLAGYLSYMDFIPRGYNK